MSDGAVSHDVIVVGAGFCGLSAAIELHKAGLDVVVLEARDRVGGRVEAKRNGLGETIDSGGQFLCDDMPELLALVRARGRTLVETAVEGAFVAQPEMSAVEAESAYRGSMAIRDRMNLIAPDDPSIAGLTVAAWLEAQSDPADVKAAFQAMIEGLWCLPLEKLPLWHLIDNDRRITNTVSELQYFVAETMHALAAALAEDLGNGVRLSLPVTSIDHGPDGVLIVTEGEKFAARAVLVAVPPATASKIAFSPALPPAAAQALSVWQSGTAIKALVRYATAFWRERGLSGTVMWRAPPGLFACDASAGEDRPALVFFIGGPSALAMSRLGETAIRTEVIERLVAALGPQAGSPLDVAISDWTHDEWSGGAYSDLIVDLDAFDAIPTLLAGAPPVHFAASELSPSFPGYIEGAIVAGRNAAWKIIAGSHRAGIPTPIVKNDGQRNVRTLGWVRAAFHESGQE